jgi:hypothetical protein
VDSDDSLLVVGSIALDSLQGGRYTDELGGSAIYFPLAASPECRVQVVAAPGRDAEDRVRVLFAAHPSIQPRLELLDAPTYRWFADDLGGRNVDLGSSDSIYDLWSPRPPAGWRGWAFLGSMRPDRQLEAARRLAGCGLLAADAMRSYVEAAPEAAREILRLADWYFCNEDEFAALGGDDPEQFRRRWGLAGLVLKHGPGGVTVYNEGGRLHRQALEGPVVDTTGAGDALAGGMLARWRRLGGAPEALDEAVEQGVVRASLAISDVGIRALARPPTRSSVGQR